MMELSVVELHSVATAQETTPSCPDNFTRDPLGFSRWWTDPASGENCDRGNNNEIRTNATRQSIRGRRLGRSHTYHSKYTGRTPRLCDCCYKTPSLSHPG